LFISRILGGRGEEVLRLTKAEGGGVNLDEFSGEANSGDETSEDASSDESNADDFSGVHKGDVSVGEWERRRPILVSLFRG